MKSTVTSLVILFIASSLAPRAIAQIKINLVPVGNPGNSSDPSDGDFAEIGTQSFGAVAYTYGIGTYEITNAQYAEFLNQTAKSDPYGLYDVRMDGDNRAGIYRGGQDGEYFYGVSERVFKLDLSVRYGVT